MRRSHASNNIVDSMIASKTWTRSRYGSSEMPDKPVCPTHHRTSNTFRRYRQNHHSNYNSLRTRMMHRFQSHPLAALAGVAQNNPP
jgi:hypothetical protein